MMNLGLTFSGGGGKGAYEIGVWKALKEFGIVEHIKAVSGTSVGALNAALFVGSDFEQGEKVWNTISKDTILSANSLGLTPDKIAAFLASISIPAGPVLLAAIRMYAFMGVFSQSGLEKIIKENLNPDQIANSDIPIFVCAYSLKSRKSEYIALNHQNPEDIVQYLLASSAMPIIWDPVVVKGAHYVDGGIPFVGDNIPVAPVVSEGCDMVISVILDQGSEFGKKEQQFNNTKFWKIVPKDSQGGFVDGTLDFDPAHAKIRITQGYEDTKEVLQNFFEFKLIEEKFVKNAEEIKTLDTNFLLMAKDNKLFRTQAREMRQELSAGQNSLQYLLKYSTPPNEIVTHNTVTLGMGNIENQIVKQEKLLDETEKNQ